MVQIPATDFGAARIPASSFLASVMVRLQPRIFKLLAALSELLRRTLKAAISISEEARCAATANGTAPPEPPRNPGRGISILILVTSLALLPH